MSLWTPYADVPLDLTKVKEERRSPVSPPMDYYSPTYQQQFLPPLPGVGLPHPGYYPSYPYQPYTVPSAQMSPVSAESTSSGCEVAPSPIYYQQQPPSLSPPESPSQRPNVLADADFLSDDPDFQAFERDALRAMAEKNGGSLLGNNPRMRRAVQTSQAVDDSYRKQRERNNFAAKQSRDRRKLREIHLALKVAYLKNEVSKLKSQLSATTCSRCQRPCDC